jgi:MFS family permease
MQSAGTPAPTSASLRRSMRLITAAGSMAMVYYSIVVSPARIAYFQSLGATEFHFGLIGAIPMVMLAMQFVGALAASRVAHRRWLWIATCGTHRFFYAVLVSLPLLLPATDKRVLLGISLGILVVDAMLAQFSVPVWFSWMGDLLPRKTLNTFWGHRHRWMMLVKTVSCLGVACVFRSEDIPIQSTFRVVVFFGCLVGVLDIALFIWVDEVPQAPETNGNVAASFLAPWRDRAFRSFLLYRCAEAFAIMFSAAFMPLYTMKEMGLSVSSATLIWAVLGITPIFVAKAWGRFADGHGYKPILTACSSFKPVAPLVFFFLTPWAALYLLPVYFLADAVVNTGMQLAANGYMLTESPRKHRSMFVASVMAVSGVVGGVAAFAGGWTLEALPKSSVTVLGIAMTNYRWVFLASFLMRCGSALLAFRVHELGSERRMNVLYYYRGAWPLRMVLFPVGLYSHYVRDRRRRTAALNGSSGPLL